MMGEEGAKDHREVRRREKNDRGEGEIDKDHRGEGERRKKRIMGLRWKKSNKSLFLIFVKWKKTLELINGGDYYFVPFQIK